MRARVSAPPSPAPARLVARGRVDASPRRARRDVRIGARARPRDAARIDARRRVGPRGVATARALFGATAASVENNSRYGATTIGVELRGARDAKARARDDDRCDDIYARERAVDGARTRDGTMRGAIEWDGSGAADASRR